MKAFSLEGLIYVAGYWAKTIFQHRVNQIA